MRYYRIALRRPGVGRCDGQQSARTLRYDRSRKTVTGDRPNGPLIRSLILLRRFSAAQEGASTAAVSAARRTKGGLRLRADQ